MKDFLEKRILNINWFFAIAVISFHIEEVNNPQDVKQFLTKIITDTKVIELINHLLTGICIGLIMWYIINYIIQSENNKSDLFKQVDAPIIIDSFIWTAIFKYAIAVILLSLNETSIISNLISGWYSIYTAPLFFVIAVMIIYIFIKNKKQ